MTLWVCQSGQRWVVAGRCFWQYGSLDTSSPGMALQIHPFLVQKRMVMLVEIWMEWSFWTWDVHQWMLCKLLVPWSWVGSIVVFLFFLSSPYVLTISPSMYGYNITWSSMWLTLTRFFSDSLWLRHYSTSRQLSLGAVPHVPTHPFMDALALVLLA